MKENINHYIKHIITSRDNNPSYQGNTYYLIFSIIECFDYQWYVVYQWYIIGVYWDNRELLLRLCIKMFCIRFHGKQIEA